MSQPNYPNYDPRVYDLLPEYLKAAYLRECEWNNACSVPYKGNDGKTYIVVSGISYDVSAIDAGQPAPLQFTIVPGRLLVDEFGDQLAEEQERISASLRKLLDIYNGKDRPPYDPSFPGFPPSAQLIPMLGGELGVMFPQNEEAIPSVTFNILRQQAIEQGEEIVGNPLPIMGFQVGLTGGLPPRFGNEAELDKYPLKPLTPEEQLVYSTLMFFLIDLVFPLLGQAIAIGLGIPVLITGAEEAHKEGRLMEYIVVNAAIAVVAHTFFNAAKSAINNVMNMGETVIGKGDRIGGVKEDLPGGGKVKVISENPYIIEFPSGKGTIYTATRIGGAWHIIAEVPEVAGSYTSTTASTNAIVPAIGLDLAAISREFPVIPENPALGSGPLGFPNWPITGWDLGSALAEIPNNSPIAGGGGSSTLNVPKPMIEFLNWFNGQKLIVVNPNNFPGWPESNLAQLSSAFTSNLSMSKVLGEDMPTPFGVDIPESQWRRWYREFVETSKIRKRQKYERLRPEDVTQQIVEKDYPFKSWLQVPNMYEKKLTDYITSLVRQQIESEMPTDLWESEVRLKIEKPDGSGYHESYAVLDITNLKADALAGNIQNVRIEGKDIIILKEADLTGYIAIEVKTSARGETVRRSEGQMRNQIQYLPMLAVRGMRVIWVVETTLSENARRVVLENVKIWDAKADINNEGDIITTSGGSISFVENYKVGDPVFDIEESGG